MNIMNQEIQQGIIKRFFANKGYGFITPDAGGEDVFFHYSQIKDDKSDSVKEGQKVSFSIVRGAKGLQASSVELLN